MKKETLRGLLLFFLCSGFWVMTLFLAASFLGIGFAQGQQFPYNVQGTVPPFGEQPQRGVQQLSPSMGMSQPQANRGMPLLNNDAMLPNQGQATYNTATQEVNIPFQLDASRLLAFSVVVDNSVQTLTLVDPMNQSLVVYHVYLDGPNMGKCELKSARNISGDLKYDNFEAMKPLPSEVRAIVEQAEIERKRQ